MLILAKGETRYEPLISKGSQVRVEPVMAKSSTLWVLYALILSALNAASANFASIAAS